MLLVLLACCCLIVFEHRFGFVCGSLVCFVNAVLCLLFVKCLRVLVVYVCGC